MTSTLQLEKKSFSKAFLKRKHWTEHELDGLFAKERNGRKVILPIWHKITDRELN
jgi:hypothetical protein